jgi:hypothetical protein
LSALVFASQSPYPGRQTVAYSRNVMCNKNPNFFEMESGGIRAATKKYKFFRKVVDKGFDAW